MADKTVYPYGTGGQLPSSIGIINDLTTGGADKALSAEQGKELNDTKADATQITKKEFSLIEDYIFIKNAYITSGTIASHNSYSLICIPYDITGSGIAVNGYNTGAGYGYFTTTPAIGVQAASTTAPTITNGLAVFSSAQQNGYAAFHIYNGTFYASDGAGYIKATKSGVELPDTETVRSLDGSCVTADTMQQGDILPKLAPLIGEPKNLLDPEDILNNKYVKTGDGTVLSYTQSNYNLAVIKNVNMNGSYVFSSNVKLTDLTSGTNGVSIQPHGETLNSFILFAATGNSFVNRYGYPLTFSTIGGDDFMGFKITGTIDVLCDIYVYIGSAGLNANLQFEKGTSATDYEEYGTEPAIGTDWTPVIGGMQSQLTSIQAQIENVATVPSRWAGCNYVAFGDSITDERYEPYYKYTSYINAALACTTYTNYGRSGACASTANGSNSLTAHVRAVNLTNYDLATIMIGVNDKGYNAPLGTISSTDTSTFYGAMNDIITYMINANKNMRIVLLTPFNTSSSSANTQNLNVVDYADAIKAIGEKYSVPVIDCYGESGVCPLNWSTYTSDNLHLNALGHQWVADYIVAQLKNL